MKKFDIDEASAVPDDPAPDDPQDAQILTTKEYARFIRWREIEKQTRNVRMLELVPPTRPSPEFRFFGIVGTWMEEDIIGASVANAFHQGCEKVFW